MRPVTKLYGLVLGVISAVLSGANPLNGFLWPPYGIGQAQAIIFLPCDFYLPSSFFPRLISAVGDWMSTILPHMVWP